MNSMDVVRPVCRKCYSTVLSCEISLILFVSFLPLILSDETLAYWLGRVVIKGNTGSQMNKMLGYYNYIIIHLHLIFE